MTEEFRTMAVAALKSAKFRQCRYAFRLRDEEKNEDAFCAIGAICNAIDPEGWGLGVRFTVSGGGLECFSALEYLSWRNASGSALAQVFSGATPEDVQGILRLNDAVGLRFGEIADILEKLEIEQTPPDWEAIVRTARITYFYGDTTNADAT